MEDFLELNGEFTVGGLLFGNLVLFPLHSPCD